jgi:hypothetical protein
MYYANKVRTINPQGFISSQNIVQDAIKHEKLTNIVTRYLEIDHFVMPTPIENIIAIIVSI